MDMAVRKCCLVKCLPDVFLKLRVMTDNDDGLKAGDSPDQFDVNSLDAIETVMPVSFGVWPAEQNPRLGVKFGYQLISPLFSCWLDDG